MARFFAALLALLAFAGVSNAQVKQSGTVTARHFTCWTASGIVQDCGTAASGFASSLGVTNNGGPGICVNSAVTTGPYNQLCLSASTSSAAQLTLNNFGGAVAQDLQFCINGSCVSLPSSVGQTFITGTPTFSVGGVPAFNSTGGNLVDSGVKITAGAFTTGTWEATAVAVLHGGTGATTAATARTNLGLGTMSTQDASAVAITGGTITGLPNPSASSDAATKAYVDATSAGLIIQPPSTLATAAVLPNTPTYANGASGVGATLTAGSMTALTVDGTAAPLSTVVLVKDQAAPAQNGIYTVTTAGSGAAAWVLTRATYFDTAAEMLAGSYTFVSAGATNANTSWVLSTTVATVGTNAANFYIFSNSNAGVSSIDSTAGAFTTVAPIASSGTTLVLNASVTPQGRLTLTTNTPVLSASVTAATTVYYTPYVGNLIPIYDGTNMIPKQFAQLTITLGNNWVTNTNYDVYVGSDSGTLRACTGAAWSSDTARAEAFARQQGILLNSGAVTCRYDNSTTFSCAASRCTYVGTMRIGATGQTNMSFGGSASGGTAALFGLWNMYNRVTSLGQSIDTGIAYNYTLTQIRQARGSAGNQTAFVSGFAEDSVSAIYATRADSAAVIGAYCNYGIGLDTTIAFNAQHLVYPTTANNVIDINSVATALPAQIGFHTVSANEQANGANVCVFDSGGIGTLSVQVVN